MATDRRLHLKDHEIAEAFAPKTPTPHKDGATESTTQDSATTGCILNADEAASLLRIPVKTLYSWAARGRLDGTYRKRGKRMLF